MEKWIGKIAVVTGASAGIGEELIKLLAISGINVVGLARRSERVDEIAKQVESAPGKIYAHKCDVSDLQSIKDAFKWIEEKFGTISILVNNAGVGHKFDLLSGADVTEKVNDTMNTNFMGVLHCSLEGFRLMSKSDDYGMIINVNSIAGLSVPFIGRSLHVYAPSKFAARSLTEVLRQELIAKGNRKIRVSNISPGMTRTDMSTPPHLDADQYFAEKPWMTPEEVARAITFLLETNYGVNITEMTIKPVGEPY